jgi:hypothetical protein
MANVVIPICNVCGKQGAVEVDADESLQRFLERSGNRRNGFKYGELIGGKWMIFCDACGDKNDQLKDSQATEREAFLYGNNVHS